MKFHVSFIAAAILLALSSASSSFAAQYGSEHITPAQSLMDLKTGNMRFLADRQLHPRQDRNQRSETLPGQSPKALIISCADARVPVEALFDQGIGDLMVVRVPGNTTGSKDVQAGIWYAVTRLRVPLVVVLGHSECEAINSIWDGVGAEFLPGIAQIVREVKKENSGSNLRERALKQQAVVRNVEQGIDTILEAFPQFVELLTVDHLRVVGAVYMLDSGRVDWLDH